MAQSQLAEYVEKNLEEGYSEKSIRKQLEGAGYSSTDIDDAFSAAKHAKPVTPAPKKASKKKKEKKESKKKDAKKEEKKEKKASKEHKKDAKDEAPANELEFEELPDGKAVRLHIPLAPGKISYHDAPIASNKLRIGAAMLDIIVFTAAISVGGAISQDVAAMIGALVSVKFMYLILDAMVGGGPGMFIFDLRIARRDGSPLGLGRALAREIYKIPSLLFFLYGYLMALWMPHNQTWHDRMTHSYVVRAHYKYV